MSTRQTLWLVLAILAIPGLWLLNLLSAGGRSALHTRIDQLVQIGNRPVMECDRIAAQRPIVILALGQSNAANLGAPAPSGDPPITLTADGKCFMAVDPLPGSSGDGGSIWYRLAHRLSALGLQRPIVISAMGVDATSIDDWTATQSPLRERLVRQLKSMQAAGLAPELILWQQGEADARAATTEQVYSVGLDKLALILEQAGSQAPVFLARSTVCRSEPNAPVRAAIEAKALGNGRFRIGPDTDTLVGDDLRRDGCHFSGQGLDRAAQLWAVTLAPAVSGN
ncbi:MAG: sialate O-acetylesterase [Rhodoferax sp.]|nr:sialate O-acetylesterase [Rhodoferax sp.]